MSKKKKNRKEKIGVFDLISNFLQPSPKDVEGLSNSSYFYYQRQLYLKLISVFEFHNLPDTWNEEYIKDNLFRSGIMAVVDNGNFMLICGTEGNDIYNFPLRVNIANHKIDVRALNRSYGVGSESEIIYFNYVEGCFLSVEPLIRRYAVLLAQCDGTLNTTLMNSRVAHIFEASNDADLETMKSVYDDVSKGKPAVFLKTATEQIYDTKNTFMNVKQTYIGNDILLTKRTIVNEYLTEIGINNANTDKRERLNQDEVNSNNEEIKTNVELWLDTINKCFERSNKLFNQNVYVTLKEKEVANESTEYTESL